MPRPPLQVTRLLLAILFAITGWLTVAISHHAYAQTPPVAASSIEKSALPPAEVEQLVKTLEDPDSRQKLIAQLKTLSAADKAEKESLDEGLLPLASQKLEEFSKEMLSTLSVLADFGKVIAWLDDQIEKEPLRRHWSEALLKLAVMLGSGLVAERGLLLALRRPIRLLESSRPTHHWTRLPADVARLILELLPTALFLAVGYGVLETPYFHLAGHANMAAILLLSAHALGRVVIAAALAILMPNAPAIRLPPLSDETASYLFIWARRLTITGVWGYCAIQAFKLLGLPPAGTVFALKLLGLLMALLLVILTLQNRQAVAAWIRSSEDSDGSEPNNLGGWLQGFRNRLADVWHILATLYVAAAFAIWALQVKGGFEFILRATALTIITLIAASLTRKLLARLVNRAFTVGADLRSQFPQLEARANRYLTIMHSMVRGAVALAATLIVLQAWGADTLIWLSSDLGRHVMSSLMTIVAVLVGALLLWELVSSSIERYLSRTDLDGNALSRSSRTRTLLPLLRNMVMIVLVIMVALIVLSELGINTGPLLAGAGVLGVAIGFGSQKLVQDVITGAFILFEDTIAVGDSVKLGDATGVVEGMTIRTLRLRDVKGQLHTVPFSNVTMVSNMSRDFAYFVFDIGVSYRENIDHVMEIIRQVGDELQNDPNFGPLMVDPIEVQGLEKFADSAVVIRGRLKAVPLQDWPLGREFNRRIKNRFDELGIEFPFPTTTLYFGQDRDGSAPAAQVHLVDTGTGSGGPDHTL